jgi:hypothetical protein
VSGWFILATNGYEFTLLMLRIAHEKHNPQMTQMAADTQKPDERTYAVMVLQWQCMGSLGASSLEHKRLVFNLRSSASSADK